MSESKPRAEKEIPEKSGTGTLLHGRYLCGGVIARGGFSRIVRASDTVSGNTVSIKEIPLGERRPDLRERAANEAEILREMAGDPGVVRLLDSFEENHVFYLVTEFLEGVTLGQWIGSAGMAGAGTIFREMLPVMETLGRIHARGILHLDVSPDNLMLIPGGPVRLIDFGAAVRTGTDGEKQADGSPGGEKRPGTDPGEKARGGEESGEADSAVRTAGYTPGEVYEGIRKCGPWSDVYSLSASIYTALTGMRPEDPMERMLMDDLKRPSALGVPVSPELENALMRGLMLDPAERWQSMPEYEQAVKKALPDPEAEKRRQLREKKKERKILAAVAAIITVIMIFAVREARIPMAGQEYLDGISWKDSSLTDLHGTGQVAEGQIRGDSLILTYDIGEERVSADESISPEWIRAVSVILGRFDAFGVPYAVGTSGSGDRNLCVKTALGSVTGIEARAAGGASSVGIVLGGALLEGLSVGEVRQISGGTRIEVVTEEEGSGETDSVWEEILAMTGKSLYLEVCGIPVARAEIPGDQGPIVFTPESSDENADPAAMTAALMALIAQEKEDDTDHTSPLTEIAEITEEGSVLRVRENADSLGSYSTGENSGQEDAVLISGDVRAGTERSLWKWAEGHGGTFTWKYSGGCADGEMTLSLESGSGAETMAALLEDFLGIALSGEEEPGNLAFEISAPEIGFSVSGSWQAEAWSGDAGGGLSLEWDENSAYDRAFSSYLVNSYFFRNMNWKDGSVMRHAEESAGTAVTESAAEAFPAGG